MRCITWVLSRWCPLPDGPFQEIIVARLKAGPILYSNLTYNDSLNGWLTDRLKVNSQQRQSLHDSTNHPVHNGPDACVLYVPVKPMQAQRIPLLVLSSVVADVVKCLLDVTNSATAEHTT